MISLPAGALGAMRAAAEALMTDTCTIEVQTDSVDAWGAETPSWAVVASGVICRVITIGFRPREVENVLSERREIIDSYRLVCPYDTALAAGQRVTLSNGNAYRVVDLVTSRTDATDAQAVISRVHD